jgi:hypothetical protein
MPAARETILISIPHMQTIENDPAIAIGTSISSLRTPIPTIAIIVPKNAPKHKNAITAIAQTAPVILTGLMYSTLSGAVRPDPHCLQNLRPSADSAPHVGQYISTSKVAPFGFYRTP